MTAAGWEPLFQAGENETNYLVVRAAPGRDAGVERGLRSIKRHRSFGRPTEPVEVDRLEQISGIPAAVAGLLGALALLAVGYALVERGSSKAP